MMSREIGTGVAGDDSTFAWTEPTLEVRFCRSSRACGRESGVTTPSAGEQSNNAPRGPGDRRVPVNPRRVRGGLRTRKRAPDAPRHWVTERLSRLIDGAALGEALREGYEYARGGQTRRMSIEGGVVEGSIQGRASKAYTTTLRLAHYSAAERDAIVASMTEQPGYAAKLLAGEVPANIEDVFAPLGLRLFPSEAADIVTTCTCREPKPWCKHAVCLGALLAERLGDDPLLIFELRGTASDVFIAMLRDRRALSNQGPGPAIVYQPQIPGVSDRASEPLESVLDRFWDAGPELDLIDTPMEKPEISHVLLRRLGQSPFTESRFPLLGLLATCYEMISERAIETVEEPGEVPEEESDGEMTEEGEGSTV